MASHVSAPSQLNTRLNVLVCNERFSFRFGLDRVLIILARHLSELGHMVSIMGARWDHNVVSSIARQLIQIPSENTDYLNWSEATAAWLERTWPEHFRAQPAPDVILVGGWPFHAALPFFRNTGARVIYLDCGAVPLHGYSGHELAVQEKVRTLRRRYLRHSSSIMAISNFLARTQSGPDTDHQVPVVPVLLGADHLHMPTWRADTSGSESSLGELRALLDAPELRKKRKILYLGRWQPSSYKNSEAAFDFMEVLTTSVPDALLLVLHSQSGIAIPRSLRNVVHPLDFPDDAELLEIIRRVDLAISPSLWEGFNLPLAELQWEGRPVLALDCAAHPEVIAHPWYLCKDIDEMASKASAVLHGGGIDVGERQAAGDRFRAYFNWNRTFREFGTLLRGSGTDDDAATVNRRDNGSTPPTLFVDVTNSTRDPANSGVIRVCRRLSSELERHASPTFVVWDSDLITYVLPSCSEYRQLGKFHGPSMAGTAVTSPDGAPIPINQLPALFTPGERWLILPEIPPEGRAVQIRRFAKTHGLKIAAIFYDAIAILHPELCNTEIATNHAAYMRGLAACDIVQPISAFSAKSLEDFWNREGIAGSRIVTNQLPGEFGGSRRPDPDAERPAKCVKILCVSTLEPRKNHFALLRACLRLQERVPDLDWSLTLVGNTYADFPDIPAHIQDLERRNPRIQWLGVVDDATLLQLYREATFTVYPSLVEGFGLPVLESLWHGVPCICSGDSALGELAIAGGCLTVNVRDEEALFAAIHRLAADAGLRSRLRHEAFDRRFRTWDDYARDFLAALHSAPAPSTRADESEQQAYSETTARSAWQDILYPQCLCDNWQMNHSERLALTALLKRHRPACSIEIGTYQGGSLSLLAQESRMVFSIDIDATIPAKFASYSNVSCLTGPSTTILPLLFRELDEAGIGLDFILLDGDHSADGIRHDLVAILSHPPTKPLFVAMHDSVNPECRRGMLEAPWRESPYVQWVDLDFVPGRLVEDGGPFHGELWGGLALAYLAPTPRLHSLNIHRSADGMFELLVRATQNAKKA